MFKFILNYIDEVKQAFADVHNRKQFKEDVYQAINDKESKWNYFHLHIDDDYQQISTLAIIPANFQISGTDADIQNKLREIASPMVRYLGYEMGWSEYLFAPDYYHIEEPTDSNDGSDSVTYLIIWRYSPVTINDGTFWAKTIAFLFATIGVVYGLVYVF